MDGSPIVFLLILPFFFSMLLTVLFCRGHEELQAVSAAIQTVLSTPVSVATALKGIQKTLGKALPFKVGSPCVLFLMFLLNLTEIDSVFLIIPVGLFLVILSVDGSG